MQDMYYLLNHYSTMTNYSGTRAVTNDNQYVSRCKKCHVRTWSCLVELNEVLIPC